MKNLDANLGIGRQLSRRRVAAVLAMAVCLCGLVAAPVFAAPVLLDHTQFPAGPVAPATGLVTIPGDPITYTAPAGNNRMLIVSIATDASSVSATPTNLADCASLAFTVNGAAPVAPITSSPVARTTGYTTNYGTTATANRVGAHVFNIWLGDSATSQTVSFTNPLSRGQVWHLATFGNMTNAAAKNFNGYPSTAVTGPGLYTNAITTPANSECLVVVQTTSGRAVANPTTGTYPVESVVANTPTPQGSHGNYMYYSTGKGPELFSWYVQNNPAGTSVSYTTTCSGTGMWVSYGASYQTAYRVAATAGPGGTLSGWTDGDHNFDTAVNITAAADPGYHFVKWEMNDAAQGVADSWVDISAAPNNLTVGTVCTFKAGRKVDQTTTLDRNGHVLRATFARNPSHTVSFNLSGGEGTVPGAITVYEGGAYGTLPTIPDYTDHNFGGWFDGVGGTGSQVTATTTVTITADQTLYAKWIMPIILTVTGAKVDTKTYDGNDTATINLSGAALDNVTSGDDVDLVRTPAPTGTFNSKTKGTDKPVAVTLSLTGADKAKYKLTQPTLTGEIQARTLTVTGAVAQNKTYDRSAAAVIDVSSGPAILQNKVTGDLVALVSPGEGSFADKTVAPGKSVTADLKLTGDDAINYSLTQPTNLTANITPVTLDVSGAQAQDKIYDGGTAAVILGPFELTGVLGADVVSVQSPGAGEFDDKIAADAKPVHAELSLTGDDAGNYLLNQPTGLTAKISKRELTVSGAVAQNKVYDGNNTAVIKVDTAKLSEMVEGDVVNLVVPAAGTFAGKSAATGKSVTALLALDPAGADAANYVLTQPSGLKADITPKPVTVSGAVAQNKPYDGNTDAVINVAGATLVGFISPDTNTLVPTGPNTFAGAFVDKNVADNISVTGVGTWGLSGDTAGDYMVTKPTDLKANITAVPLTVSVIGNPTKSKDGNTTTPALDAGNFRVDGLVAGESILITANTGTYASAEAGEWLITVPLAANDFAPVGAAVVTNYILPDPSQATGNGTITLLPLPEIISWPSNATAITLGQQLGESTLSGQASMTPGTFGFSTSTFAPPNAGVYNALVSFTPTNQAAYAVLSKSVNVTVNKATPNLTLTATSITPGQALSASTLGGTAKNPYNSQITVPGVFSFDAPDTVPPTGNYSAAVTFTPQVPANYNNAVGNVTVVVASLVLKVTALGNKTAFLASPGDDVTLQVVLADVTAPVKSYAWYAKTGGLDWTLMPNEDAAKLVLKAVTAADGGQYKCEVTDSSMSAESPVFTLTVGRTVPVAGLAGLAALAAVLGLGGAAKQRRRK